MRNIERDPELDGFAQQYADLVRGEPLSCYQESLELFDPEYTGPMGMGASNEGKYIYMAFSPRSCTEGPGGWPTSPSIPPATPGE